MISFIIPAHNEERLLGATIASIHAAARDVGDAYEIIVVDDGSTDRTADVARAQGAQVVSVNHRRISKARNAGARAAAGDVLVFVDADTMISAAVVRATLGALRSGAVGGGASVNFTGPLPMWARATESLLRVTMRAGRMIAGCYVFCARDAFERAGGFDETLYVAEELALSVSLKRYGRVVILREHVRTSGRKLRTHSLGEQLRLIASLAIGGRGSLTRPDKLAYWYGPRRADKDG